MDVNNKYIYYLYEGKFIKRYKRFFLDFVFYQKTLVAHCPNTGTMLSTYNDDSQILFDVIPNPKRKLPFSLEFLSFQNSWVMVNTFRTNQIISFFLIHNSAYFHSKKIIYDSFYSEKKLRIFKPDFILFHQKNHDFIKKYKFNNTFKKIITLDKINDLEPPYMMEVKNVTYYQEPYLLFPDARTQRGTKHIKELLIFQQRKEFKTILLFLVSRKEGKVFRPAFEVDKEFSFLLKKFYDLGGRVLPIRLQIHVSGLDNLDNSDLKRKNAFLKQYGFKEKEIIKSLRKVELTLGEEIPIFFESFQ